MLFYITMKKAIRLMQYYLTIPKHLIQVVIEDETLSKAPIESEVQQGIVIGTLLFLCHINDLPLSVTSKVRLLTDDCLLYRTITSQQDHTALQKDLSKLKRWANKWDMRFNAKKCYMMSINCKSTHFYTLCDHILKQVEENPYLRLTLTESL